MSHVNAITDVPGVLVGHWSDAQAATGCTVVVMPPGGAKGAVHVRGRATGTREIEALAVDHLVGRADAVLLTGGSAFGLGAADGVMRWLRARGRGFTVGAAGVVPIVPTAVIFDLGIGSPDRWPGPEDGEAACDAASDGPVGEGSVGAGTGATVGKVLGVNRAMKGGVGTASVSGGGCIVGALAVANALGDVHDEHGHVIAGAREDDGSFARSERVLMEGRGPVGVRPGTSTTLVVLATNARLSRLELEQVARMGTDALARHIRPLGTAYDGDMVVAVTTDATDVERPILVEVLAQQAVAAAIMRAVRCATGLGEIPGLADAPTEG